MSHGISGRPIEFTSMLVLYLELLLSLFFFFTDSQPIVVFNHLISECLNYNDCECRIFPFYPV